jgi:hypothetical protein
MAGSRSHIFTAVVPIWSADWRTLPMLQATSLVPEAALSIRKLTTRLSTHRVPDPNGEHENRPVGDLGKPMRIIN